MIDANESTDPNERRNDPNEHRTIRTNRTFRTTRTIRIIGTAVIGCMLRVHSGVPMSKTTVRFVLRVALASAAFLVAASPAHAQWLNLPTPGIPRLPNGAANLKAPAPKTADGKPDFSGIWRAPTGKYLANLAADGIQVPMTPWAQQIFKQRTQNNAIDRPSASCLPHSVTDFDAHQTPRKVLQSPGLLVM